MRKFQFGSLLCFDAVLFHHIRHKRKHKVLPGLLSSRTNNFLFLLPFFLLFLSALVVKIRSVGTTQQNFEL
ncbi:MAG: hypothetical protein JWP12_3526 [Bacteroidetes bacterium]|nr:hypothetical protein [Bacteroidota bacterium]